jgi:hypothetical protein
MLDMPLDSVGKLKSPRDPLRDMWRRVDMVENRRPSLVAADAVTCPRSASLSRAMCGARVSSREREFIAAPEPVPRRRLSRLTRVNLYAMTTPVANQGGVRVITP